MKARETRVQVIIPARMRVDTSWFDVRVRNMSSRGIMVEANPAPARGAYIEIARGLARSAGRVVWSSDGRCGIRLRDRFEVTGNDANGASPATAPPRHDRRRADRSVIGRNSRRASRTFQRVILMGSAFVAATGLAAGVYDSLAQTFTDVSRGLTTR